MNAALFQPKAVYLDGGDRMDHCTDAKPCPRCRIEVAINGEHNAREHAAAQKKDSHELTFCTISWMIAKAQSQIMRNNARHGVVSPIE